MSDAFATNRKLSQVAHIYCFSLIQSQRELRLSAPLHVDLPAPSLPIVAHDPRSDLPGIRNPRHVKHKGTSPERHLLPRGRLVCNSVLSLISCVSPQILLFSLVLLPLPLVPTVALSTTALVSQLCPSASRSRASSQFTGRISAPAFVSCLFRVGSLCPCFGPGGRFDTKLLPISERSLIGPSVTLACGFIYHSISLI